jgi:hypothetical protein
MKEYQITPEWKLFIDVRLKQSNINITHKCGKAWTWLDPYRMPGKISCGKCHESLKPYFYDKVKDLVVLHELANLDICI